jgi:hypothetical protein
MAGQWPPQQPPQQPPGYPYAGPPPPPSSNGTRVLIIVLAVVGVLIVLGIGGCVACGVFVGSAVDHGVKQVDKELRKAQNRNSIADAQARAVETGARRESVIARFGPPAVGAVARPSVGRDCIFYNVRDGTYGSQWEFCFVEGRLTTKSRR